MAKQYPHTPDGRYFVAKNRLWRCTDPRLGEDEKRTHIKALMKARRAVRTAQQQDDEDAIRQARNAVQSAKEALGERGPVWWDDDAPDEGGLAPHNSSYAKWWETQHSFSNNLYN